jgi:hypothetical protein
MERKIRRTTSKSERKKNDQGSVNAINNMNRESAKRSKLKIFAEVEMEGGRDEGSWRNRESSKAQ